MGTSSRTPASENEGAGRLSLRWSVTIPVVKLLLLHSGRLHASAVADPCSKALIGLTNYLHCRDYLFKGQNSTHPSVCGRKGSCNLSVLAIISGSVLLILYKCSFLEPQWCGNSQGAFTGLEETAGIDLPCQCAFSAVYLTSCEFSAFWQPGYVYPAGFPRGASPVHWGNVRLRARRAALGWRRMPCSAVWRSFRKCQGYCGEVGIEQGWSRKAWRKKLVKQSSKGSPLETGDGNRVAEVTQGEDPRVFTAIWPMYCTMKKSQSCSELQGCNSTLRI